MRVGVSYDIRCFISFMPSKCRIFVNELACSVQINNRCIQDLHIFRDPSRIPIVIIERVMNAPRRSISENSYLRHFDMIDAIGKDSGPSSEAVNKLSASVPERSGRILKIVVFVHGFQASIVLQIYDFY